MAQAFYSTITTIILLFSSLSAYNQTFYVNAWKDIYQRDNLTYQLTAGKCDTIRDNDSVDLTIYTCPPSVRPFPTYIDSNFTDIAIDKDSNIFYLSLAGDLYVRRLNDTTSCSYIGTFLDTPATFSGLVADTSGTVYAAANRSDYCILYKYDNTGFKRLGTLPKWVHCSGDLFFYQHRLFMSCVGSRADTYFVYEIALADPAQSCYYMPLTGMATPWAAFTVVDSNNNHRVYISSTDTANYSSSWLVKIDIPGKQVLDTVCYYPFLMRGAAAYYSYTGDTTYCPIIPKSITKITPDDKYFTVYNPSQNTIRINTNINQHEIRTVELYDMYGKKVRQFNTIDFPENITTTDLPYNMYVIAVSTNDGKFWKEKVLISSGW